MVVVFVGYLEVGKKVVVVDGGDGERGEGNVEVDS